jgi:putative ABC transport system substrate-binding protein
MSARRLLTIGALAVALFAGPPAGGAQPRPLPRVGILSGQPSADLLGALDQFRQELAKLGWIEGQTVIVLELRSAEGRNERLPALAAELLKADPRIIVALSAPATRILKEATATTPIVMWGVGDPVEYALVASLASPGGNVTGTSYLVNEVAVRDPEFTSAVMEDERPLATPCGRHPPARIVSLNDPRSRSRDDDYS